MSKTELIFPVGWEFGSITWVIGRIDKFSRFPEFVIFFYSAHGQARLKLTNIVHKRFVSADREFRSIIRVLSRIEKFGLLHSSSFSIVLT